MKHSLSIAVLVGLALVGCAVDPTAPDPDEGAGASTEEVGTTTSELRALDPSKYCLPGEVVKCTLGPPPVCRCVPATTTPPILSAY